MELVYNGIFYLRNANTTGGADLSIVFGLSTDLPVAGNWDGLPLMLPPTPTPSPTPVSSVTNASFTYDGDGKRVKSTINGTTTNFVGTYFELTGSTVTKYYYAGSQRIAMRTGVWDHVNPVTGTLNFMVGDHLGSTSLVTDANGQNSIETRYKAWGEVIYVSGNLPTKYQYTGQFSNVDDFGLMYYNARWYDPYITQFSQPDSIIPDTYNPQDWNRYAYARNNPLKYTDPSGHDPITFLVLMGLATVALLNSCSPPASTPSATASDVEWIQYYIDTQQGGEAIDLAITTYDINTENVNGSIKMDWKYEYVGESSLGLTTPDREVYISPWALHEIAPGIKTSPGLFGALIAHEATVHTDQIANHRGYTEVLDPDLAIIQRNVNEIEAWQWMLDHADEFGLTGEEIQWIRGRRDDYYNRLPDNNKKRVNDENYEIP